MDTTQQHSAGDDDAGAVAALLPSDLIGTGEAATLAGAHTSAVIRWVKVGLIRGWRRCGRVFVSRSEVLGLFEPVKSRSETKREKANRKLARVAWELSRDMVLERAFGSTKVARG